MRLVPIGLLLFCLAAVMGQAEPSGGTSLKPDLLDVRYGPHERHVLDLYKAHSEKPTPLLVWIHGGGFLEGDKTHFNPELVKKLLATGISVAIINYRYSTQAPAPAPFMDAARAVQFLRSKAKEWNLDPAHFATAGNSAGAGMSLWLAFHADLADPKNADPVLRESTRVSCVYVTAAQTSYDPRYIKANIPGNAWKHEALVTLFALKPGENENPPADKSKLMEDLAPINLVAAGAPPVYMVYGQDRSVPASDDPGATIHHPRFGDLLKEKMDALKIECVVRAKGEPQENPTPMEFLQKYLKAEKK
jgi:acetyl esterase/lipase